MATTPITMLNKTGESEPCCLVLILEEMLSVFPIKCNVVVGLSFMSFVMLVMFL